MIHLLNGNELFCITFTFEYRKGISNDFIFKNYFIEECKITVFPLSFYYLKKNVD